MKREIELLAPAGSYEGLVAAVNAGADAVYIGGQKFGARAYAENPMEDELIKGIRYAHLHGSKVHMTVNTLLKERELEQELYNYIKPYYQAGLDAVIVQDFGVFSFLKEYFPELPIHASTQMTITGVSGARLLKENGAERVVLARELSLKEVREICAQVDVEVECFVHGAVCYCYSGQCLFSSFLGGRSGNRGRCAQPCRLPYETFQGKQKLSKTDETYPLSLKDMMTVEFLPELIKAGITSFKIEGRMKRPEYAAGVVEIYRRYIDGYLEHPEKFQVDVKDRERLLQLYSRSGNSKGYYMQHNGRDMLTLENPAYRSGEEKMFQELQEKYTSQMKKHNISGILRAFKGKTLEFCVTMGEIKVQVEGAVVEKAQNQPMTQERIEKQLKKTGGTSFQFEQLEIQMEDDIFLPMQALNELRRNALLELERAVLAVGERKEAKEFCKPSEEKKDRKTEKTSYPLHVSVETAQQLKQAIHHPAVAAIYVDASLFSLKQHRTGRENSEINDTVSGAMGNLWLTQMKETAAAIKESGKQAYFYLPAIFRQSTVSQYNLLKEQLLSIPWDGIVIRSLDQLGWLKELGYGKEVISDFNLYAFNQRAIQFLKQNGVTCITYPLELTEYELRDIKESAILTVYGHIPFMTTAQCVHKTFSGCDQKAEVLTLKDRYKKNFYAKNYCDYCYNVIRNGVPLSLLGAKKAIKNIAPSAFRLLFSIESGRECKEILDGFAAMDEQREKELFSEFTRGHMKKGVE